MFRGRELFMVRKICPICDQVMKGSHYCRNCRSWVKHPYVREVNYYLNERHPQKETGCVYHGSYPAGGRDASGRGEPPQSVSKTEKKPAQPGNTGNTAGWVFQGQGLEGMDNGQGGYGERTGNVWSENGQSKSSRGVIWVAVAIVLMVTAGSFLKMGINAIEKGLRYQSAMNQMFDFAEEVDPSQLEWDYEEDEDWNYDDFWENSDYNELTDEEALATGVRCSGDEHFDISGEEMEKLICRFLEEQGFRIEDVEEYSYNSQYCDDRGNAVRTYFSTYTALYLEGEDAYEYVELDCDTVTGELHGVHLVMEDEEKLVKILEGIIEILGEECDLPWEDWIVDVRGRLPVDIEKDDGYDYMTEDIWLWGYYYGDYYTFTLDAAE